MRRTAGTAVHSWARRSMDIFKSIEMHSQNSEFCIIMRSLEMEGKIWRECDYGLPLSPCAFGLCFHSTGLKMHCTKASPRNDREFEAIRFKLAVHVMLFKVILSPLVPSVP